MTKKEFKTTKADERAALELIRGILAELDPAGYRLHDEDEDDAIDLAVKFIRENDKGLPDAYNKEMDELMGDLDWDLAAYGREN